MLEKTTGYTTNDVAGWYQRNGFYKLASNFGGYGTYTGRIINREAALDIPAFYAGTKIISEDLGALPFFVYQRDKARTQINKFYDHPLYRTLHDLVNPEIDAGSFVEALTAHALMLGNGYAQIQRFASGVFLWPWQPEETRADRDSRGTLYYIHRENGQDKTYARADVFDLRGWTLNGVQGENTLKRARQMLGITDALTEYAGRYFANDATPGVVLTRPQGTQTLGPLQVEAIKDAWKRWHQGLKNSHEPAVLQDGMDVKIPGNTASEAQLIDQRKYQVIEACRILRLSPHKLSELDHATFANIEHLGIEYVTNTLAPWVDRWRRAVYRCLLTFDEQQADQIWAEHDVSALQKGDFATQSEGFRKLLEKGVYSINEVRKWLNLNPVPGGDEHFIQLNMATVQDVASGVTLAQGTGAVPISKELAAAVAETKNRLQAGGGNDDASD